MSIQLLSRRVGAKGTLASLTSLALVFYGIWHIRSEEITDIVYITIVSTAAITLLVSIALIGALKILRGETTFKRILIYVGCGVGFVPLWILMPMPFGLLLPFCFAALIYGIGGYIGFCIKRRRNHAA